MIIFLSVLGLTVTIGLVLWARYFNKGGMYHWSRSLALVHQFEKDYAAYVAEHDVDPHEAVVIVNMVRQQHNDRLDGKEKRIKEYRLPPVSVDQLKFTE